MWSWIGTMVLGAALISRAVFLGITYCIRIRTYKTLYQSRGGLPSVCFIYLLGVAIWKSNGGIPMICARVPPSP
ncbi:hypothetical protein GGS21DRAFT_505935 [Xylaria nigripes]|nr:hypothetical protein GGS21DRAFT_505935 [Xylaria nigripes]